MKGLGIPTEGRLYATMREALSKSILDGDIAEYLEDGISEWICSFDVSSIVDVFKSGFGKVTGMFGGDAAPAPAV